METPVFEYPLVDLNGRVSHWLAAHSPIIIKSTRKDFVVTNVTLSGSSLNILVSGAHVIPDGTKFWLYSENFGVVKYDSIGTVGSSAVGVNTNIFCSDIPLNGVSGAGWLNSDAFYKNWRISTAIYKRNPAGDFLKYAQQLSYPDPSGFVSIDITNVTSRSVSVIDTFIHDATNEKDDNICSALRFLYTLLYTDENDDEQEVSIDDDEETLYFTNAAMPLGHESDSNVPEFVPAPSPFKARWLIGQQYTTHLNYWNGMPMDVSFIVPEDFAGGITLKGTNPTLSLSLDLTNGLGYVHRICISDAFSLSAPVGDASVWLEDDANNIISDTLTIRVKDPCKQPFYLKWLGANGGWNYFMFEHKQFLSWNTSSDGTFSKYITELSKADTDSDYINKKNIPEYAMGTEQLDIYETLLIWSLLESVKVMWLINIATWVSFGSPKWQTVKINTGKIPVMQTNFTFNKTEFSMKLVEHQLQTL